MTSERDLEAARAGDGAAFERLVGPHRRELEAHCYRMLGSIADAEDATQEALLRAWKGLGGYEGRTSLRRWLYRIATHVCIDLASRRKARALPHERGEPLAPGAALEPPQGDPIWIDPAPDALWQSTPAEPEATISARESVALALLVALQTLPPQQRAALILREVLGWSAAEVADLLETSVAAVNSALQRARESLEARPVDVLDPARRARARARTDADLQSLLRRYVSAWEAGTSEALAAVLREDAVLTMPPIPSWLRGVDAIAALVGQLRSMLGEVRFVLTSASGAPALAAYVRGPDGAWRPLVLHVPEVDGDRIAAVHAFQISNSFRHFGLPAELSEEAAHFFR